MDENAKVAKYLEKQLLCVVATVDKSDKPESALVAYLSTPKLELIISSSSKQRKNHNLLQNPNIAVVIGLEGPVTVQYEGVARLMDNQEARQYLEALWAKNPAAKQFANDPTEQHFIIKPNWIRYTDYSKQPFEVIEFQPQ